MPTRGRRTGPGETAVEKPPETVSSDTAKAKPGRSGVSVSVKTATTVSPSESEIATVAYQLWIDSGRPAGSDQEYWFRAEAILKSAFVAKRDTGAESGMPAEFVWEGHWEIWESEWGGSRWIWDSKR